jgi:hypothetical protein
MSVRYSSVLMDPQKKNYAFVDGQNLHMSTAKRELDPWRIDLSRFRIYLSKKYNVSRAYYFVGYQDDAQEALYEMIRGSGFILVFREHSPLMLGKKKGNVDSDIIFAIMKSSTIVKNLIKWYLFQVTVTINNWLIS